MRLRRIAAHRPSCAMGVAIIGSYIAYGAVGWAAVQLPAGSVGTQQLRNGAVTSHKLAAHAVGRKAIARGAVGRSQINSRQVQARVSGQCGASSAVAAINSDGSVRCEATLPTAVDGSSGAPTTIPSGRSAPVSVQQLPGTSGFLVLAHPEATITAPSGEGVRVDCTIGSTSTSVTRTR